MRKRFVKLRVIVEDADFNNQCTAAVWYQKKYPELVLGDVFARIFSL